MNTGQPGITALPSQVRCEAGASHLDRVIADSGAAEDAEDRSQHAA